MRSISRQSAHLGASLVGLAAAGWVAAILGNGCAQAKLANGQACLKSEDCASSVCSDLVCAAAPMLTDAETHADVAQTPDAGPSQDGGSPDAVADGPSDAPSDVAPEASDAAADAAGD